MRMIQVETACAAAADEYWKLRCDFAVERAIAAATGRTLTCSDGDVPAVDAAGHPVLKRFVVCEFVDNPIPGWLRNMFKQEALVLHAEYAWYPTKWDEAHPCSVVITAPSPLLKNRLEVRTKQWLSATTATSCVVHTRAEIFCTMMGVGSVVEGIIDKDMRHAYALHPDRVLAHTKSLCAKGGVEVCEVRGTMAEVKLMADAAPPLAHRKQRSQRVATTDDDEYGGAWKEVRCHLPRLRLRRLLCCGGASVAATTVADAPPPLPLSPPASSWPEDNVVE